MDMKTHWKRLALAPAALVALTALAGCPFVLPVDPVNPQYDAGFNEGFFQDDYYWDGYYDGYDTVGAAPIYYDVSHIPILDDGSYDAGYYDGLWYAYNDGYFVNYDYAFTIGFSEGYDAAFYPDWPEFIADDRHIEWDNGGWGDGYNDGFSEGRILGAYDYEEGFEFDWFDAMLFYRDGGDVAVIDADGFEVGTGTLGPVLLWEYGLDPHTLKSSRPMEEAKSGRGGLSVRRDAGAKQDSPKLTYRDLTSEAANALNVTPNTSIRGNVTMRLDTSWLQRVQQYQSALKDAKTSVQPRN
jgi:hypothetical protein